MSSAFRRVKRCAVVVACLLALAAVWWVVVEIKNATATPRKVLVTISKDTTYITAPLRPDGYPDYGAALNRRLSDGVTLENNSAVLIQKAVGPNRFPKDIRKKYFEMLGVPAPPDEGDYFIDIEDYAKARPDAKPLLAIEPGSVGRTAIQGQYDKASERPWSKKEFPVLADWLATNEKPLALVTEATKRPRRYDPFIAAGDDAPLLAALLPAPPRGRELSRGLVCRAMLRVQDGDLDGAWQDLLACHRLARLIGQCPTIVEMLVAITVDFTAGEGETVLLRQPNLTAKRIAGMRDDLAKLPRMPTAADMIDFGERLEFLDAVSSLARGGTKSFASLGDSEKPDTPESIINSIGRAAVDWNAVLRMGNSWYDRGVAAARKPTRAERLSAADEITKDFHETAEKAKSVGLSSLFSPRRAISQRIGLSLLALMMPDSQPVCEAEDRSTMHRQVHGLAFALAAYHADRGTYPEKLAELMPKYVSEIPKDIFNNDADLHFRREAGGYALYSVGSNGKDDGGKGYADHDADDHVEWDDIGVRIGENAK
jgi:hypothetical protein